MLSYTKDPEAFETFDQSNEPGDMTRPTKKPSRFLKIMSHHSPTGLRLRCWCGRWSLGLSSTLHLLIMISSFLSSLGTQGRNWEIILNKTKYLECFKKSWEILPSITERGIIAGGGVAAKDFVNFVLNHRKFSPSLKYFGIMIALANSAKNVDDMIMKERPVSLIRTFSIISHHLLLAG